MDREQVIDVLNRVLDGTVNSVAQYISICDPYVPPGYEERMEDLFDIRDDEVRHAHELTNLVLSLEGNPKVGVFEYWNVDLNYLDLRFLAGFAAKHQEKVLAELDGQLDAVRDEPAAFGLLTRVREEKRVHLATLRDIGGADSAEAEPPAPAESTEAG